MRPATDISELSDSGLGALSIAGAGARWRWGDFYELTKPRMNVLVVLTTMVGFYMAVGVAHEMRWSLLLHTVLGTAATAAAASVLNQFSERQYDALMSRTCGRPLPFGDRRGGQLRRRLCLLAARPRRLVVRYRPPAAA